MYRSILRVTKPVKFRHIHTESVKAHFESFRFAFALSAFSAGVLYSTISMAEHGRRGGIGNMKIMGVSYQWNSNPADKAGLESAKK